MTSLEVKHGLFMFKVAATEKAEGSQVATAFAVYNLGNGRGWLWMMIRSPIASKGLHDRFVRTDRR